MGRVALESAIWECPSQLKVGSLGTSKVVLVLRKNLQGLAGDNSKMRTCKINNAEVAINISSVCVAQWIER